MSEWLIYVGAFRGAAALSTSGAGAALLAIAALSLTGGLAAACFVKAFGVVFLGQPRSEAAARAHEAPAPMTVAMWLGAALCAVVGFAAVPVVRLIGPVAASLAGLEASPNDVLGPLGGVVRTAAILSVVLLGLALLRKALLGGRDIGTASTWGCGYAEPSARMQYTAASFAAPVLEPFDVVFHRNAHSAGPPLEMFPSHASHDEHLEDRAERTLVPAVRGLSAALSELGFLQRGRVQLYIAYVLATLIALLAWQAAKGAP